VLRRRRGLNREEYLTDVLARLPSTKIHQIHLPLFGPRKPSPPDSSWQQARSNGRLALATEGAFISRVFPKLDRTGQIADGRIHKRKCATPWSRNEYAEK
jgi:hypothetical protein